MKKLILLVISLFLFTGCGNSKKNTSVECEKQMSDSSSKIIYKDVLFFEKNTLVKVESTRDLIFENKGENVEILKGYANTTNEEYNKIKGVKAELETTDKTITFKIVFDVKKMSKKNRDAHNLSLEDKNPLVKQYEINGYTCK